MANPKIRNSDVVIALFLLAITAMLLVPLPTLLLDFLLVVNISFAVLLLMAGLYMPNTLALLSFPSLLLLTTLFRLGLNVASTRLILSQGNAGQVIQAFGGFLIRGEVVVGIIIFLIITVVNFIVIARGATRISEVAARFTLDALPGKQLAIDSDLRANLISALEAQRRRDDLRKESQLYGSMDGAMKFVQGDAIAGLFIIAVNILGGMYMGVQAGMSFAEAVQTYTTLTVGDGLVNQIPAILISICSGLVVTRVASAEGSSLGSDVHSQVFSRPGSLMFAGALIIFSGLLPGVPKLSFLFVGCFLVAAGLLKRRAERRVESLEAPVLPDLVQEFAMTERGRPPESREQRSIVVGLDSHDLFEQFEEYEDEYLRWWRELQGDVFSDWGIRLPQLRVVRDQMLTSGSYAFYMDGALMERGTVPASAVMVEVLPEVAESIGLSVVEEGVHPANGHRVLWTANNVAARRICQAGAVPLVEPFQFIALRMVAFFVQRPEELVSVADTLMLETQLEKQHPGLVTSTVNRGFVSTPRMTEVLQQLIREGLSIREFQQVVEAVSTYCATVGASLAQEGEFDLDDVVGFIRKVRRRHVLARLLSPRGTLKVLELSPEVEAVLQETARLAGGALDLPVNQLEQLRQGILRAIEANLARGVSPLGLMCSSELRGKVVRLLRQCGVRLGTVVQDEIEVLSCLEPAGLWQIERPAIV